jgi:hypothetical protein
VNETVGPDPSRSNWSVVIGVGSLLGIGLLIFAAIVALVPSPNAKPVHRPEPPPKAMAAVVGISAPGDYRNPFFGFRLKYDDPWRDVTEDTREKVGNTTSPASKMISYVLLSIMEKRGKLETGNVNVIMITESLAEIPEITTGSDYLVGLLIPLMKARGQAPKSVRVEEPVMIAGIKFDKVVLIRSTRQSTKEVSQTYWATVKDGYVLFISGTHASPEELKMVEDVVTGMTAEIVSK